jgi:hypothetical protein
MSTLKRSEWYGYSGDGFGCCGGLINWGRHQQMCPPGMWLVEVFIPSLKFKQPRLLAVVDDFGALVQVGEMA